MVNSYLLRIQDVPRTRVFLLIFVFLFSCPDLWAYQEAIVTTDKAVIYSDQEMTSPVGYAARGKKIAVGKIARNKAQVYPIVVSGKIAYIRVIDVSTEKETMKSSNLTAERFSGQTLVAPQAKYVASYYSYLSQMAVSRKNEKLENNDSVNWYGVSLKGEAYIKKSFDLQMMVNWMMADVGVERFRMTEVGTGFAIRLIDNSRFLLRWETQALVVPFATYAIGDMFRKKTYGGTLGTGLNSTFMWNKSWGLEVYGGYYYTRLMRFSLPAPYLDIAPSFSGFRAGVGLNYTY